MQNNLENLNEGTEETIHLCLKKSKIVTTPLLEGLFLQLEMVPHLLNNHSSLPQIFYQSWGIRLFLKS